MLRNKILIIAFVIAGSLFSTAALANTCPSASPQGVGCTAGTYYCSGSCRSGLSWCPTWSPSPTCASGLDCSNCSSADSCGVCNACNSGYRLCGAYPSSFCKANNTLPANCASYNTNCDGCSSCVAGYTLSGSSCVPAILKLGSSSVSGTNVALGGADSSLFVSGSKVGIGNSGPTANLHLNATTDTEGLRIITSNYSPFIIRNSTDTADLFRIDQDGNITGVGSLGGGSYFNLNGSNLYASSTSWNLGIGTTNPGVKLEVSNPYSSSRVRISSAAGEDSGLSLFSNGSEKLELLYNDGNSAAVLRTTNVFGAGIPLIFKTDDVSRVFISGSNGNVGIGTTNATDKLTVLGAINSNSIINGLSLCIAGDCKTSWGDAGWAFDGNTVTQMKSFGTLDNYSIPFLTNGTERMRLTNAGNLAIGANDTGVRLHVESPAGAVAFFKSTLNGGNYSGYIGNGQTFSGEEFGLYYALNDIRLATYDITSSSLLYGGHLSSDAGLAIDASGNVGIGTTTPEAKLHVSGPIRFDGLSASTATSSIVVDENGDLGLYDLSTLSSTETAEYSVSTTAYQTFMTSGSYVDNYHARLRVTSYATASSISGNVMYVDIQGSKNYVPTITVQAAQNSTGTNDSGIYRFRAVYPTALNNGAPAYIEFATASAATRYIKVEVLESSNLNLLQTNVDSLYNSANQTQSYFTAYYNGTTVNKTIYGSVSGSSGSSSYSSYGVYSGYSISNGTVKTNQWEYVGNMYLAYNGTYSYGQSWNIEFDINELARDATKTHDQFDNAKLILHGYMPSVSANSTTFNNTVPSFSITVQGTSDLNPDDVAMLVYSTSTSVKYLRLYVRLKNPNTHYAFVPVNRYGASYNSAGTPTTSYCYFNYANSQATVSSLPTPAQGSVVYGSYYFLNTDYWRPNGNNIYSFNSGNVGVGVTSPTRKLQIDTNGAGLYVAGAGESPYSQNIAEFYYKGNGNSLLIKQIQGQASITTGGPSQNLYLSTNGANSQLTINATTGYVGIGMTAPDAKLAVSGGNIFINDASITSGTPKAAVTKEYLDSAISAALGTITSSYWNLSGSNLFASSTAWNIGLGTTNPGAYKLNVAGSIYSTGLTLGGDVNLGGHNITGINKLTVSTIDPLYSIKGINYSTFASAIVGGVKEEYVGQLNINKKLNNNEYEKVIDFDKVEQGSDLWVWRQVIDFSPDNVQVLITPFGSFADTYYNIEGNSLIFRADRPVEISYRLIGKRFDWKEWPTKALDQTEKAGLIIH